MTTKKTWWWTPQEDAVLRGSYKLLGPEGVKKLLANRSIPAIKARCRLLGIVVLTAERNKRIGIASKQAWSNPVLRRHHSEVRRGKCHPRTLENLRRMAVARIGTTMPAESTEKLSASQTKRHARRRRLLLKKAISSLKESN